MALELLGALVNSKTSDRMFPNCYDIANMHCAHTFGLMIDLKMSFWLLRILIDENDMLQELSIVKNFFSKFVEDNLVLWEAYCKEACLKATGLLLPSKLLEMVR
jgi:hypothetical protein